MQTDQQSQQSASPELARASEAPRAHESGFPIELVLWLLLLICGLLQLKVAHQLEQQLDDKKLAPAAAETFAL